MSKVSYKQAVNAAGDLWITADYDTVIDSEYLKGQIDTLSNLFDKDEDEIREDILDAAGIYRDIKWNGKSGALIMSDSSPWIQDKHGNVFNFGGEDDAFRMLHWGVLVSGTEIQANDEQMAGLPGYTDLHAAQGAAQVISRITGRKHHVWFHGTN